MGRADRTSDVAIERRHCRSNRRDHRNPRPRSPVNGPITTQAARIRALPCLYDRAAMSQTATAPANAESRYTVHRGDLPLSCPTPQMALWNSHPRVYLPIEDEPNCEAKCPYCGALFVLAD